MSLLMSHLRALKQNARPLTERKRAGTIHRDDYLVDFMTGAGAALGQHDAASNEVATARMASLTIFIMVFPIWWLG